MKKVMLVMAILIMVTGCDKIKSTLSPNKEIAPTSATEPVSK